MTGAEIKAQFEVIKIFDINKVYTDGPVTKQLAKLNLEASLEIIRLLEEIKKVLNNG